MCSRPLSRSSRTSLPGIAAVLCTFLASPPPIKHITDSPAASPADAEAANQAAWAAKKKGYTPQKVDLRLFSKALQVRWQGPDDPPAREVDAGLLGGILRDKFGAGLSSISDTQLNHMPKFTIVGVKLIDYDKGMKLTRQHIAQDWKMSLVESKKQPYTPRAPHPDTEYPARKTDRGGRGQKQRCKQEAEDEVDLTGGSDSDGVREAKHQRRYSPHRQD